MNDSATSASLSSLDMITVLDLDRADISSISVHHEYDFIIVDLTLNRKLHPCPFCSTYTDTIKGYQLKKITHSVLNNIPCIIHYRARRYICPICGKTFYEHNPISYTGSKTSVATVYNVLEALREPSSTFTSVGKQFNLSASSVANIFDRHVSISRRELSECICFDEVYAFKDKESGSDYVCVLLDYNNKKIIDLLPTRYKDDLMAYFQAIPLKEREKVKYVSFDMWKTYRVVSKIVFPNCICIVDKFHVLQELMRKVTRVRIRAMNRCKKEMDSLEDRKRKLAETGEKFPTELEERLFYDDRNYYLLKKFNWILFSNDPKISDPNHERRYNKKLKRLCNYNDLYHMLIDIDEELRKAVEIRDTIHDFYKNTSYEDARRELDEMIRLCKYSSIPELIEFSKTLIEWKPEIINSFIKIPSINRKMNNALIENRNKSIKLLKHSSNGYRNWSRFRNRVLYSLNDDTTFKL